MKLLEPKVFSTSCKTELETKDSYLNNGKKKAQWLTLLNEQLPCLLSGGILMGVDALE